MNIAQARAVLLRKEVDVMLGAQGWGGQRSGGVDLDAYCCGASFVNLRARLSKSIEVAHSSSHGLLRSVSDGGEVVSCSSVGGVPQVKPDIDFVSVCEEFHEVKTRGGLSLKGLRGYVRFLSDWREIIGVVGIQDITRADVRRFVQSLALLPKRNLKIYKDVPVSNLLEMDIPVKGRVKPKTAHEGLKWVQSLFVYAVRMEYVQNSPARDLKLNLNKSISYASYSNADVRLLLDSALRENEGRRWVVWLAAYSGMRLGEIVQLTKSDILTDSDTQRIYIRVTDLGVGQTVKTEAGIRQVPVHKALLEAGFADFVSKVADGAIFTGTRSKSTTQWFRWFRESCGIPLSNDFGQRYVFHSFRHTVVTMARRKGVPDINVQQVIGHEKIGVGVTDRYTHNAPLKGVLGVIDCLDYS